MSVMCGFALLAMVLADRASAAEQPTSGQDGQHTAQPGGLLSEVHGLVGSVLRPVSGAVAPVVETAAEVVRPVTDAVSPVVGSVTAVVPPASPTAPTADPVDGRVDPAPAASSAGSHSDPVVAPTPDTAAATGVSVREHEVGEPSVTTPGKPAPPVRDVPVTSGGSWQGVPQGPFQPDTTGRRDSGTLSASAQHDGAAAILAARAGTRGVAQRWRAPPEAGGELRWPMFESDNRPG
ncbi:hypothetical protein QRX50_19415 [Amycolatopsis carbonis]|uniref:Secreted protein n=1 Tax=Amycolatopsis carbonis TaxID=715471 RepID=A0A9Y2IMZ2_9PSEU|nr:hypothetical protein [Amycolatopsis sp. 2-15]WIX82787.1 hypothetical protein QRX50_19415 [Amycolatopsis sp. 2-15]